MGVKFCQPHNGRSARVSRVKELAESFGEVFLCYRGGSAVSPKEALPALELSAIILSKLRILHWSLWAYEVGRQSSPFGLER